MLGRYIVMIFMLLGIGAAQAADLDVPGIGTKTTRAPHKNLNAASGQKIQAGTPAVRKDRSAVKSTKRKDVSASQPVIR
jgi:type IV secretory pathway TrbL component